MWYYLFSYIYIIRLNDIQNQLLLNLWNDPSLGLRKESKLYDYLKSNGETG
jgi:hypothetical protein